MDSLNDIPLPSGFRERVKYLTHGKPILGKGSGRVVCDYSADAVLKIAYNKKGIEQNKTEVAVSSKATDCTPIARVLSHHPDYSYILQQKADLFNDSVFENSSKGITVDDFFYFLRFKMRAICDRSSLFEQALSTCTAHGLDPFDVSDRKAWGIIGERPVLIDYGLTLSTARRLYKVSY